MTSEIPNTKALILLASRPESVEVAVGRLGPEAVGVIVSQEILPAVVAKCSEFGDRVRFLYRIVDSPMEISDAFGRFEHLLSELEDSGYSREEILLDATGGTTPMRLGVSLAAMTRGVEMIHQRVPQRYVNGRWERDEGQGIEIHPMRNPLEATGLLREGQAVDLFNRRDYAAAARIFEDVAEKVSGVARGHYYRGLLLLSEGYAAWDVADYGEALEKLKAARAELGVGFAERELAERSGMLVGRISNHLPFLGRVRGRLSVENVIDMLENARRRIEDQRRYDDGVARLYRTLEMWHQWRLQELRSISTAEPDWSRVDEDARQRFLEAAGLDELPEVLALRHARILDRVLDDGVTEDDEILRDLLRQRNHSILAHGLEPIGEKAARRFLEYVDALVEVPEVQFRAQHATLQGL